MDDILCGADIVKAVIKLRDELNLVLGRACFKLNKWISNKQEVLFRSGLDKQSPITLHFNDSDVRFYKSFRFIVDSHHRHITL